MFTWALLPRSSAAVAPSILLLTIFTLALPSALTTTSPLSVLSLIVTSQFTLAVISVPLPSKVLPEIVSSSLIPHVVGNETETKCGWPNATSPITTGMPTVRTMGSPTANRTVKRTARPTALPAFGSR